MAAGALLRAGVPETLPWAAGLAGAPVLVLLEGLDAAAWLGGHLAGDGQRSARRSRLSGPRSGSGQDVPPVRFLVVSAV